jgi:hypothetical protein
MLNCCHLGYLLLCERCASIHAIVLRQRVHDYQHHRVR